MIRFPYSEPSLKSQRGAALLQFLFVLLFAGVLVTGGVVIARGITRMNTLASADSLSSLGGKIPAWVLTSNGYTAKGSGVTSLVDQTLNAATVTGGDAYVAAYSVNTTLAAGGRYVASALDTSVLADARSAGFPVGNVAQAQTNITNTCKNILGLNAGTPANERPSMPVSMYESTLCLGFDNLDQATGARLVQMGAQIVVPSVTSAPGSGCFAPGTRVLVPAPQGTALVPIEQLQRGDAVLSAQVGPDDLPIMPLQLVQAKVAAKMRRGTAQIHKLCLGEHAEVLATNEHPFFTVATGWKQAHELQPGSTMLHADGSTVPLGCNEEATALPVVYNLMVEPNNNFFVAGANSDEAVLVHNMFTTSCGVAPTTAP